MPKGKVTHVDFSILVCQHCGRPAQYFCDMPIAHHRWAGHPPRSEMEQGNAAMAWTQTCDKPMCGKCALSFGKDIHICPDCAERVRTCPPTT